jgi:hypothetical protein
MYQFFHPALLLFFLIHLAKRKAEIEEIEKYLRLFDVLPVNEQNRLKTTFIKTLKPFEQNRIKNAVKILVFSQIVSLRIF